MLVLLTLWGDEHYLADSGRPRIIRHRGGGGSLDERLHCERCGKELELQDLELEVGPGLLAARNAAHRYPWRVGEKRP